MTAHIFCTQSKERIFSIIKGLGRKPSRVETRYLSLERVKQHVGLCVVFKRHTLFQKIFKSNKHELDFRDTMNQLSGLKQQQCYTLSDAMFAVSHARLKGRKESYIQHAEDVFSIRTNKYLSGRSFCTHKLWNFQPERRYGDYTLDTYKGRRVFVYDVPDKDFEKEVKHYTR